MTFAVSLLKKFLKSPAESLKTLVVSTAVSNGSSPGRAVGGSTI